MAGVGAGVPAPDSTGEGVRVRVGVGVGVMGASAVLACGPAAGREDDTSAVPAGADPAPPLPRSCRKPSRVTSAASKAATVRTRAAWASLSGVTTVPVGNGSERAREAVVGMESGSGTGRRKEGRASTRKRGGAGLPRAAAAAAAAACPAVLEIECWRWSLKTWHQMS